MCVFCVCIVSSRRLVDTEDELSDIQSDSVPSEVRDWLASTFTRQMGLMLRRTEEKPRFRSIVHAVQAGIFVERYVVDWYTFSITKATEVNYLHRISLVHSTEKKVIVKSLCSIL